MKKEKDTKINILFIIDSFTDLGGGTERHLLNLTTLLDRQVFGVFVCFFDGAGEIRDLLESRGVRTIHLPVGRLIGLGALVNAVRLARFIRKNKIKMVQTFHFKSDTYGALISRLSGVRYLVSSRRDTGDLKSGLQTALCRMTDHLFDAFIAVCRSVKESLVEKEGVAVERIHTIYNGVDLQRFAPPEGCYSQKLREKLGIGEDTFVVGTVAWFRPEKAYGTFLEGVRFLKSEIGDLRVIIVGDGSLGKELRAFCSENELERVVEFVGYVDDVKDYLSIMDVFCLVPNSNEGFSNAILEAMASGKPVVATSVGGNPEAVVDGVTGFIIPPDDPAALSAALNIFYNNERVRQAMGRSAKKRAADRFAMEGMISTMENLYTGLIGCPGAAAKRMANGL